MGTSLTLEERARLTAGKHHDVVDCVDCSAQFHCLIHHSDSITLQKEVSDGGWKINKDGSFSCGCKDKKAEVVS